MGEQIRKIMSFDIKELGEPEDRKLRFTGSDETEDRDGDIIEVSGWQLDNFKRNPVILFGHDYHSPAVARAENVFKNLEERKLVFDVKFPTTAELSSNGIENASEHAKFVDTIYNLYKHKYMTATSVGFIPIKWKVRDDGEQLEQPETRRGTRFLEQELLELSLVPVPSNPMALQNAKSYGLDVEPVERAIAELEKHDALTECDHCGGAIDVTEQQTVEKPGAVLSETNRKDLQAAVEKIQAVLDRDAANREPGPGITLDGATVSEETDLEKVVQSLNRIEQAVNRIAPDVNIVWENDDEPVIEFADEPEDEPEIQIEEIQRMVTDSLQEVARELKEHVTNRTGKVF